MTEIVKLTAEMRERVGTGGARACRRDGRLPGIIYGGKKESTAIQLNYHQLFREINLGGFLSKLVDLEINGKSIRAIPREVHWHPVKEKILHIDFMRVTSDSKITVAVPLRFINEEKSPGLKRGGMLNVVMHEVDLTCPANNIPDHLDIDVAELDIYDTIHTENIKLPAGMSLAHAGRGETTIVTVVPPSTESAAGEATTTEGTPS